MKQKKESLGHKFPSMDTVDLVSKKIITIELENSSLLKEFPSSPPDMVIQEMQPEVETE